jgi:hypothetical protein
LEVLASYFGLAVGLFPQKNRCGQNALGSVAAGAIAVAYLAANAGCYGYRYPVGRCGRVTGFGAEGIDLGGYYAVAGFYDTNALWGSGVIHFGFSFRVSGYPPPYVIYYTSIRGITQGVNKILFMSFSIAIYKILEVIKT